MQLYCSLVLKLRHRLTDVLLNIEKWKYALRSIKSATFATPRLIERHRCLRNLPLLVNVTLLNNDRDHSSHQP